MRSQIGLALLIGAAAGMVGAFFGVGGGIILVPMMVIFLKLRQHQAHGTSLAVIFPLTVSGAIIYALHEHIDWVMVGEMALGSVIGAIIGARLMVKVPALTLRRGFALFALLLGLRFLIWGGAPL